MAMGTVTFNLLLSLCIYLFILLFFPFLLLVFEKGKQTVNSQCERLKIYWYSATVKLYILSNSYGTRQITVTGLQDSGWYMS
jgi:hypothetical protein